MTEYLLYCGLCSAGIVKVLVISCLTPVPLPCIIMGPLQARVLMFKSVMTV